MKTVIAALCLLCSMAHAETYITIPTISQHSNDAADYNESHLGIGIQHDWMVAGYYRNSFDRDTCYAGGVWRPVNVGGFTAGVAGVVLSGYKWPVAIIPTAGYCYRAVCLDVLGGPLMDEHDTWFVAAQLRIKVGS